MATNDFVVKNGLDVTENAIIRETTDSSSKDTGALIVEGGVGIEKKLYVGTDLQVGGTSALIGNTIITGDLAVNGGNVTTTSTTATVFNTTATTLNVGQAATTVSIGATTGTTTVRNALTVGGAFTADSGAATISPASANVVLRPTGTGVVTINPATLGSINNMSIGASTRSTGAFTTLAANGITTITSTQASTSVDTGALQVDGGVGINGAVYAGSLQNTPVGSTTASTGAFTSLTANSAVTFTQNTGSTSTTSGTLVVTGGVGISERLYAGSLQNTPIGSSVASSAAFTSLTANAAVTFTQNTASTTTSTGTLVVSGGIGLTGAVNAGLSSTFNGLSSTNTTVISPANAAVTISPTGTGTVTINPSALGTINNMSIGADQAQSGKFTALVVTSTFNAGGSNGTSGQVLVSTGAGIQWATSASIQNGSSNVSVALNGNVTVTSAGTLITTFSNTNVNIPVSTASTQTTNGALTVAGGVGIGGNLFAGGSANITGVTNLAGGLNVVCNPFRFQRSIITQTGQDDNVSVEVGDGDITFTHNNDDDGDSSTFNFSYTTAGAPVNLLSINATGVTYRANTVWHAGNDGAGSGLDADTLDGFGTSQAAAGSTIPVRDSNGYLYGNYINMTDESRTSGVTAIICKAGDNFYRSATAGALGTFINTLGTGTTLTISVSGNAGTVTNGVYTTGDQTIGGNKVFSSQVAAPNFYDGTGSYNVNLGSGNSEGRGLAAGYSGGFYGGIGYNVRHNASSGVYIAPLGDTSSYMRFENAGFTWLGAGVGTAGRTLTYATRMSLDSSNNLTVAGTITEQSSIVYKTNVNPIDSALDKVLKLVGVTYDRKDGTKLNEAGLIAEEVAAVIPSLVLNNDQGKPNSIAYSKLTAYLVECIKELNAKIERLEGKQ